LKGELFSSKTLIVGASGEVDADITVASLIVFGTVKGLIKASDRVELLAGANLEGEVISPVLVVAEGANFNGNSQISSSSKVVNVVVDSDHLDEENT
jgi:cytoskeletal protein CcmA (bactofilin family)